MVKPAGLYLDVISAVRGATTLPVAAYQVSGEYAQIHAAAAAGWLDLARARDESLPRDQARRRRHDPDLLRPRRVAEALRAGPDLSRRPPSDGVPDAASFRPPAKQRAPAGNHEGPR